MHMFDKIRDRSINIIISSPKTVVIITAIICFALCAGIVKLQMDFSARYWFQKDSAPIQTLDLTRSLFPASQDLIINIETKSGSFKDLKNTQKIHELSELLEEHPLTKKVETYTNFPYLYDKDEDIYFENIFEDGELINIEKESSKDEIYKRRFFSKSFQSTLIYLSLNKTKTDQVTLMNTIEGFIEDRLGNHYKVRYGGFSALEHNFNIVSQSDLVVIVPLICLIFIVILFYIYGSFTYAVVPMVVFIFATIIVFGFAGHFNMKFHNVSTIIPGVLITIAMADIMHIISAYLSYTEKGYEHIEALTMSAKKNFTPTITTTLTTASGFLSFATVKLAPVAEIGILCGFGTIIVWILTYYVFIPILALLPKLTKKEKKAFRIEGIFNYLEDKKKPVYIISALCFIVFIFIAKGTVFNTDPYKYFSKTTDMYKSVKNLEEEFEFIGGPELLVKTEGKLRTAEFMNNLAHLRSEIEKRESVRFIAGPLDMYETASDALIGTKKIAKSDKEISDIWNFLTLFGSENNSVYNHVSIDESYMRLNVAWNIKDSKNFLKELEKIKTIAKKYKIKIEATGSLLLYHQMTSSIVPTLVQSTLIAVCVIFLFFLVLFKSLKIALLSLIPNVIPLIFTFAMAKVLGYTVDLTIAMVAAVSFGLAVDDTIHIFLQYKMELETEPDRKMAMLKVFDGTGQAIVITTISLFIGFLSFSAGDFVPNGYFGLLCALAFLMALILDVVLLPLILVNIKMKEK